MGDVCDAASRNEAAASSSEESDDMVMIFLAWEGEEHGGDVTPSSPFRSKDGDAWEGDERFIDGVG
jgi:hypothetical protein